MKAFVYFHANIICMILLIDLQVLLLFVADLLNSIFDIYWLYGDIIIHFGM